MLTNLLITVIVAWIVIRTVRKLVASALKAGAHKLEQGLEKGAREGARGVRKTIDHARERAAERHAAAQRSWAEIEREGEGAHLGLPGEPLAESSEPALAGLLVPEPIEAPAPPPHAAPIRPPVRVPERHFPTPPVAEPPRPRTALEPELTPELLHGRLFADSPPGFEISRRFQEQFRGRRVRWTGELDRADRRLGGRPIVQVTVETPATSGSSIARPLRWTFSLDGEAGTDLVGQRKRPVTVEGTLLECDPYLLLFTLGDVERSG